RDRLISDQCCAVVVDGAEVVPAAIPERPAAGRILVPVEADAEERAGLGDADARLGPLEVAVLEVRRPLRLCGAASRGEREQERERKPPRHATSPAAPSRRSPPCR